MNHLENAATAAGTSNWGKGHPHAAMSPLGGTGLLVSAVGFGGYRVAPQGEEHRSSIIKAVRAGVNLIDTSANYTDGGSETVIGQALAELFKDGVCTRENLVIVSKAGYVQGSNLARSRQRRAKGDPYPDLVEFAPDLEHCIHPDFLSEQLSLSLGRLGLDRLDVFLLHNPEYYLAWAVRRGLDRMGALKEYYRRIGLAFERLEQEAQRGRISFYGVSGNAFVLPAGHGEFTCLEDLWALAEKSGPDHRFKVVQFPFNLLETAAVTEANQPSGVSVLEFCRKRGIGVLTNRPLNAVLEGRLVRLAEVTGGDPLPRQGVLELLMDIMDSEDQLKVSLLPGLEFSGEMEAALAQHLSVAQPLLRSWEKLGGLEHWRATEQAIVAQVNLAFMHLAKRLKGSAEGLSVLDAHLKRLQAALKAIWDWHAVRAKEQVAGIKSRAGSLDSQWGRADTMSQMALRAVRSTEGVSCVLMGMRRREYVDDAVAELRRPVKVGPRQEVWERARSELKEAV